MGHFLSIYFFVINSIYVQYHIYWFVYVAFQQWNQLILECDLLNVLLYSHCNYFIKDSSIYGI